MKGIKKTADRWEWRTHLPILNLITEKLTPGLVVELGVGVYSSPVFLNLIGSKIILIDNNQKWLDLIKNRTERTDNIDFFFQDLGANVTGSTAYDELDSAMQSNIREYFSNLSTQVNRIESECKLLFVDNYTCVRAESISLLYDQFDIIVYHDAEEESFKYKFDNGLITDYSHYIFKTPRSWTGIFIKHKINLDILKIADSYIEKWCIEEQLDPTTMYIEEIHNDGT